VGSNARSCAMRRRLPSKRLLRTGADASTAEPHGRQGSLRASVPTRTLAVAGACGALALAAIGTLRYQVVQSPVENVAYIRSSEVIRVETGGGLSGYRAIFSLRGNGRLAVWTSHGGDRLVRVSRADVGRLVGLAASPALMSRDTADELRKLTGVTDVGWVDVTTKLVWRDRFPWRYRSREYRAPNLGQGLTSRVYPDSLTGQALAKLVHEIRSISGDA
jgi:hypothetical protein